MIAIAGLFLSKVNISNDTWDNLSKCMNHSSSEEINILKNRKNESIENITKNINSDLNLYIEIWESAKKDQDLANALLNVKNCDKYKQLVVEELTRRYEEKIIFLDPIYTRISLNEKHINLVQKFNQAEESETTVESLFGNLSIIEGN